jgi:Domain of unknown function (DUF3854)
MSVIMLKTVRALMRKDLRRSGLTESDLYVVPRLTDLRGEARPGYVLRYPDPDTGKPNGFYRFRYLNISKGLRDPTEKSHKYDQPAGESPRVYFSLGVKWPALRDDVNQPLFITEGEKKAAAACSAGFIALGLGGVWNYKTKGKDELIPDLATFIWKDRVVFVVVDSDAARNEQVLEASDRLCALLSDAGARCSLIILPEIQRGVKTGWDDYLLAKGAMGFQTLIAQATEWEAPRRIMRGELLHRAVGKSERILATKPEYKLFRKGTELVRVVEEDSDPDRRALLQRPRGNTYLAEIRADNIELLLSKTGCIFTKTKEGMIPADPKQSWSRQVISNIRAFPDRVPWRQLHFITSTPLLLKSGALVDTPGYDPDTKVWFDPRDARFPSLPPRPTKKEARAALDKLGSVFGQFPYAIATAEQRPDQTPSYSAVLATVVSTVIRHLLPTVPMLGVTAPEAGTGKTKIAESIAVVATGHPPTRISYDSAEEFEKILPVGLRAGDRVLLLDNIDRQMNSPKLAMVLTTDEPTEFRVLGESRTVKTLNHAVIIATGNQLVISGDLPRRALLCRLTPNVEQPEMRRFDFDPVARAFERFPELVMAVFTALRYYFQAGCPQPDHDASAALQSGSFEEWNRVVRGLLLHLGFADPLATQAEIRGFDTRRQSDVALAQALHQSFSPTDTFSAATIKRSPGSEAYILMVDSNGRWDPVRAGLRLVRMRDRTFEGLRVHGAGRLHGVALYQITCERKGCKECEEWQKRTKH